MDDCRICPLWEQWQRNPVPEGAGLAWELYQRLSAPAVEKFGLQDTVMELAGLDMDRHDGQQLIDQLNAIVDGLRAAGDELNPRKARGDR